MTLRNRVSAAAAVGVLIVVASVSSVLYFFYAASLRSRADLALVDAAQQAVSIAREIKQSVADGQLATSGLAAPVTVGSVQVQLFPGRGDGRAGRPVRAARQARCRGGQGRAARVLRQRAREGTAVPCLYRAWPGNPGGLVRTSRAANGDDGALRNAALLLAALTVAAAGVTYGAARLTAGRILRPIAELTAAAEHVTQTRDLTGRLRLYRDQG